MTPVIYVSLIYFSLFLMMVVSILGYIRLYVEYNFKNKLDEEPNIVLFDKS
jgi:hypothetical protein